MSPSLKEFKIFLLCFIIFFFTFLKYIPNLKFDKGWGFFFLKNLSFAIKASMSGGVCGAVCGICLS